MPNLRLLELPRLLTLQVAVEKEKSGDLECLRNKTDSGSWNSPWHLWLVKPGRFSALLRSSLEKWNSFWNEKRSIGNYVPVYIFLSFIGKGTGRSSGLFLELSERVACWSSSRAVFKQKQVVRVRLEL